MYLRVVEAKIPTRRSSELTTVHTSTGRGTCMQFFFRARRINNNWGTQNGMGINVKYQVVIVGSSVIDRA